MAVNSRLGGHFVSGHIDGVGTLLERIDSGDWSTFWFSVPRALARQMASKGSIAVDGVSLTIVDSEPDRFSVALIPFTLSVTTLGKLAVGGKVNLETDILAKYVQRLVESKNWARPKDKASEISDLKLKFEIRNIGLHVLTENWMTEK